MENESKVTYVTLSADNEELHSKLDAAIEKVRGRLGQTHPLFIGGKERPTQQTTDSFTPADTRVVVARVASATTEDVNDAVRAARAAFADWRSTPWQRRVELVDRAAVLIRESAHELSAWLMLEMGKNRIEALGEIEETADLYHYYAEQMRANGGFSREMGRLSPADTNTSVLRPYGVWAVIAPWNFPYALMGAPAAAALVAGNTVVMKPSSETPLSGVLLCDVFRRAGLPAGTVNLVTGSGRIAGDALALHPDVAGLTFTGSYDVGFEKLYRRFSRSYPKPCIVEMGGKNPAIVMDTADLDRAVTGVYRSAFGMGGQKCSACSRVYVHEKVARELVTRLVSAAQDARIGDPLERTTFLGPVGTRGGFDDYARFSSMARESGTVRTGGAAIGDGQLAHGFYVRPTVVTDLPRDHLLMKEELFLPIVCVQTVGSLDEALEQANDTRFGLTAGFFSGRQEEIDAFLDRIEAGVVYVNRAAGATTGAWPGVQPFGGWKGSGSTGKNIGGLYTVQCYLREQSRTLTK
ncbi:MAG: aldehyde dehydrogenase family protein [Deltaproteobacteria bacterium]|nr:aldehyde dehydrogenase family protein [Deltaproteobacteria bacterium]